MARTNKGARWTKEEYKEKLKVRSPNVRLVGVFTGIMEKVELKCISCKSIFTQRADGVLSYSSNCKCVRSPKDMSKKWKITKDQFLDILKRRRDLILLGEYTGTCKKVKVRSNLCGHEFMASPGRIKNGGFKFGCLSCSRKIEGPVNIKGDHTSFIQKLKEKHPHIKCLSRYVSRTAKLEFECKYDGYKWSAPPHHILGCKYGCMICSRNATGYKRTDVVILGKQFRVQGYEGKFLRELALRRPTLFKEIKNGKEVPRFKYDAGDQEREYQPDFYLPSKNLIIEIKSTYTAAGTNELFENLVAKRKAVIAAGYKFKLIIWDKKSWIDLPSGWFKNHQKLLSVFRG